MNRLIFGMVVLMGAMPSPAFAQTRLGALGYLTYGQMSLTSADSFEAIGSDSKQTGFGGGGSVTGLWRGLFVDVGVSQQRITGERVFIDGSNVYRLDIPLSITIRPIDMAAGWRFTMGRLAPYIGGGLSRVSYEESDTFAGAGDSVRAAASGGLIVGGVDVTVLRWAHVGAEVRHRLVTGVLGEGGVSAIRGDDQLGGTSFGVRIGIGR